LPVNIAKTPGLNAGFSFDKKFGLLIDRNNFIKVELSNGKMEKYQFSATTTPADSKFFWSADSSKVLAGQFVFFVSDWDKPADLKPAIGSEAVSLKWSLDDGNLLYYKKGQNIFSYHLGTKAILPVSKDCACADFMIKKDSFYSITAGENQTKLKIADLNGKLSSSLDLPFSSYKFINPNSRLLNLYDDTHKILYLIDPALPFGNLRDIINNAVITVWINDNKLLYSDGYEIKIFNLANSSKVLLTRISNKINSLIWHPSNNYILFNTDQELDVLELDNRDKYNITKILDINSLKNSVLSSDGKILYFYGQIGKQQGLFELAIQS
jgi:hypothetical protein